MNPIDLISASAGTGKTWTLGKELLDAIQSGISADQIMAVTFTRAAAAELEARSRQRLLEENQREQAQLVQLARIGTVHSVFGSLLSEHALASGRSPETNVIPDTAAASLFRMAADDAIRDFADAMIPISDRFGVRDRRGAGDWRDHVKRIVDLARENGIDPDDLAKSASRSLEALTPFLDSEVDGDALDKALRHALSFAVQIQSDGVGKTDSALDTVKSCEADLGRGPLPWGSWIKLAGLAASAGANSQFQDVRDVASKVLAHPRLHADIKTYIEGVFGCAAKALKAYDAYKRPRGLVDFADQEALALSLLDDPSVIECVRQETDLLMVDEFQDTSPMQLALFLRMAGIVKRSLWVGDAKQAIYGFRGTDPALVSAVAQILPAKTGGKQRPPLTEMRRSVPELVSFNNEVFTRSFPAKGIPAENVEVKPCRSPLRDASPALRIWRLQSSNQSDAHAALAAGVDRLLKEAPKWPVCDRMSNATRTVQGGDIAILMRTNDACAAVAANLAELGIKVALSRPGLLSRAECIAAVAGLRWLSDKTDTIALAELSHVMGGDSETPEWLSTAVEKGAKALGDMPDAKALEDARAGLANLTPSEALDAAISALNLTHRVRQFGDPTARLAALDALRGLARQYEDEMLSSRLPATASGLAAWLGEQEDAEEPASPDPDAVRILTVHRAKGLEWPIVMVAELEKDADPRLFDCPTIMSDRIEPDPSAPLAGRWIRFWPWAFGANKKVALADRVANSFIGQDAARQRDAEEVRLLYVAFTRARDYLILAPREKATKKEVTLQIEWLQKLGAAAPDLNSEDKVTVAGTEHRAETWRLSPTEAPELARTPIFGPDLPSNPTPGFLPRNLNPSALPASEPFNPRVKSLGGRLPLTGAPDMTALGEALHGIFAADDRMREVQFRVDRAAALLNRWGISALAPRDAIEAADRLWKWIENEWPAAKIHREWPVSAPIGQQRIVGRVDLIVEHDNGLEIIDHKSFPGGQDHWPQRCGEYRPQLEAYAGALEVAMSKPVCGLYVHLPVSGTMLQL